MKKKKPWVGSSFTKPYLSLTVCPLMKISVRYDLYCSSNSYRVSNILKKISISICSKYRLFFSPWMPFPNSKTIRIDLVFVLMIQENLVGFPINSRIYQFKILIKFVSLISVRQTSIYSSIVTIWYSPKLSTNAETWDFLFQQAILLHW